ncbi:hypothetical protein L3Q82_026857, partial [Scortum barcoo]
MRAVARRFAVSVSVVSRAWRRYQETGQYIRRRGTGGALPEPCKMTSSRPQMCMCLLKQFLQDKGIDAMDWPARSPDLNPIEHIWDIMSRSIHQRHIAPQTVQELADALVQVWEEIPQETIRHLI